MRYILAVHLLMDTVFDRDTLSGEEYRSSKLTYNLHPLEPEKLKSVIHVGIGSNSNGFKLPCTVFFYFKFPM